MESVLKRLNKQLEKLNSNLKNYQNRSNEENDRNKLNFEKEVCKFMSFEIH